MCQIKELRKCDRRVVVNTKSGKAYYSKWKVGDTSITKEEISGIVSELKNEYDLSDEEIVYWSVNHLKDEDCVLVSEHAMQRIHERNGWNRKTTLRMMKRIYEEGLRPEQTKGHTRRYLLAKQAYNSACEYVLYGEYVYVFINKTCVTAFPINRILRGTSKNWATETVA